VVVNRSDSGWVVFPTSRRGWRGLTCFRLVETEWSLMRVVDQVKPVRSERAGFVGARCHCLLGVTETQQTHRDSARHQVRPSQCHQGLALLT